MVKTSLSLTFTPINTVICGFLYFLFFFFRTMPEIHINGRSSNSSLELDELGTSYVTGSSLLVPAESYNLSTAISTPTNTMDTGNSFCGIVFLIICFWFALVIMIAIGIWLVRKRKKIKTQEYKESNVSLHLLPIPKKMNKTSKLLLQHIDTM